MCKNRYSCECCCECPDYLDDCDGNENIVKECKKSDCELKKEFEVEEDEQTIYAGALIFG